MVGRLCVEVVFCYYSVPLQIIPSSRSTYFLLFGEFIVQEAQQSPPQFQKVNILVGLIILTSVWRQFGFYIHWWTVDPILAFEIILLFKSLNIKHPKIVTTLSFIGSHSMNIFMFHTFIYYYYFEDFIYYTRNPLLIFITLLVVCLILSMGIEYLKKKLHFAQCQQKIINKLI